MCTNDLHFDGLTEVPREEREAYTAYVLQAQVGLAPYYSPEAAPYTPPPFEASGPWWPSLLHPDVADGVTGDWYVTAKGGRIVAYCPDQESADLVCRALTLSGLTLHPPSDPAGAA